MLHQHCKPLNLVPSAEDLALHEVLCDTARATERLGDLVPLLKAVGFKADVISAEKTVLSAPLLESAMNQNGTHQASVFYLLADYTLGVGMFATLPGCYTVGIHDRCSALPVQFWLRAGSVHHLSPGTGLIRAEVSISPDAALEMRQKLITKGRCELRHEVNIYQGERLVAVADHTMGLYADLPRAEGVKANLTQVHAAKTSALLIAGLREGALSKRMAQDQGIAIAERMCRDSPQLRDMVLARSESLRRLLAPGDEGFDQVVLLGAGLDTKPIDMPHGEATWFACDLPEMLKERARRLEDAKVIQERVIDVPLDFRLPTWPDKLLSAGYDPQKRSLLILEGVSMYLESRELFGTGARLRELTQHPGSRLWLDHVTPELIGSDLPEVQKFLNSMERLGEPFRSAFMTPQDVFPEGWDTTATGLAADFVKTDDPIFLEYRFSIMRPCALGVDQPLGSLNE